MIEINEDSNKRKRIYYYWPLILILLTLIALCSGYYISSEVGNFPDEAAHLGYVLDAAKHGFPDYTNGKIYATNKLNYLSHPALYYVIAGLFDVIASQAHNYSFKIIRLVNLCFSAISIAFIYKSLMLLNIKKNNALFALFILLSLPMFIILSISINNDILMILGCTIFYYSLTLVYFSDDNNNDYLPYMVLGCLLTALTKATGSLSLICILMVFSAFNIKLIKNLILNLKRKEIVIILVALAILLTYYLAIHHIYGKFYPSAQSDPSIWYSKTAPDALRRTYYEQLVSFFEYNYITLVTPYGHRQFFDFTYRRELLSIIIMLFPFSVILTLMKTNKNTRKFIIINSLAFILYLSLYFIKIKQMNYQTGYPGAMQSRYFYGFIPYFIITYALALQCLKNIIINLILRAMVISSVVLSFYPAYISYHPSYYGQESSNINFNELHSGMVFSQNFPARSQTISKVAIFIGTYARVNHGELTLSITSPERNLICSYSVKLDTINDNSWVNFPCRNDSMNKGETYTINVVSNPEDKSAITWWALSSLIENPIYQGTNQGPPDLNPDRVIFGNGRVDGSEVNATFTFKIYK